MDIHFTDIVGYASFLLVNFQLMSQWFFLIGVIICKDHICIEGIPFMVCVVYLCRGRLQGYALTITQLLDLRVFM